MTCTVLWTSVGGRTYVEVHDFAHPGWHIDRWVERDTTSVSNYAFVAVRVER